MQQEEHITFYLAVALLNERDLHFRKHAGVHAAFGEHFAKTGVINPKFHRWAGHISDLSCDIHYGSAVIMPGILPLIQAPFYCVPIASPEARILTSSASVFNNCRHSFRLCWQSAKVSTSISASVDSSPRGIARVESNDRYTFVLSGESISCQRWPHGRIGALCVTFAKLIDIVFHIIERFYRIRIPC